MTDSQNAAQDNSAARRSYSEPSGGLRPTTAGATGSRSDVHAFAPSPVGGAAAAPSGAVPSGPAPAVDGAGRAGFGRVDTGTVGRTFAKMGNALGGANFSRPVSPSQVKVRKARLRVARVDPWSVMKVSFVLSIALGIVTLVATAVVWNVLKSLGVFSSLDKTVGNLTSSGSGSSSSFNLMSYLSFGHVEGYALVLVLVDVVLVTALATLGSYLYNLASGFVGGFEVTLAEDQ